MSARGATPALAAYVMHRYDWSESSLIVELFTRELGRVVVAAKGAKRPTSQLRAVLRPFQRIQASLGRSAQGAEVHNLRAAEWAGGVPLAGGDALFSGFYLNELLLKLLAREDPHPLLWDAYATTLLQLGGADEATALRGFELRLLREIGLLPDLARVTATQVPLHPSVAYALRPDAGVVTLPALEPQAVFGSDWLALQAALDGDDLSALQRACATPAAPLRRQLRDLLAYHLGAVPLRTRQVLLDLQPLL
jgi:DNA repair protein RecO (recombination protein O)